MNEYKAKTTQAKLSKLKADKQARVNARKEHIELVKEMKALKGYISRFGDIVAESKPIYPKEMKMLDTNIKTLLNVVNKGITISNLKDIERIKEVVVSNLGDIAQPVIEKTEIPKWLASKKSIKNLNVSVMKVVQGMINLEASNKPKQDADNFLPFRRVIRQGNRLVFDDSDWASRGGGGGAGGGSSGGLTDTELRATPVPVSGTVTANLGTLNGAATTAKQDTLLTELQAKADLNETQPVSLSSVPSHPVTNAGTFATQATLQTGSAAIGKLAANSGVDIGDVDVTSMPDVQKKRGATSAVTQVGDAVTSTTLKALNLNRIRLTITNDSSSVLYVKEGATASATSYTYRLAQYDAVIIDDYTGVVDGIWVSDAAGFAYVTEIS